VSGRRLRTLLVREVRATLRDPFTVACLMLVPILALLAFGYILATDVSNLSLGVHDASASASSRRLVAELAASGAFDPRPFPGRAELEDALASGRIGAALLIPRDFERDLGRAAAGGAPPELQVLYDGAEAVLAGNADAFLRALVAATGARLVGADPRAVAPTGATAEGVEVSTRILFNPRLEGVPFMVSGTFGFVLSFLTVLITAVSIVNERLTGTFDQLQLTPATTLEILLGKLLPLGAVFALDVGVMMLIGGFLLGVWPAGSALFFLAVSSYYVLTSLSLGLIFSATSATAAEAVQKTVLFSIPLVQLSGFAFPIRNMPEPVQWFAELLPATHYIRVCRAIYLRGEGPLDLLGELAVIGVLGAALVALALRTLERRS
jgi:ABC-2 type transport system permease protein